MRTPPASLAADEGDTRLRARRGMAIYFAILVPLILGGVYLAGQPPALSALLWVRQQAGAARPAPQTS